ncbi:MAG: hypothetical protein IKS16_06460 [Lachnospiraceae bacterium]|nr:hypothetical protein [Lachnospiraceae bacterium]
MSSKKITIIISSCVAALAAAGGVTAGVILYRGADARAVKQGVERLIEDIGTRSEEVISAREAAGLVDEVMYGNAHIDMSVNVGGIDASGVITDDIAGTIASGILGNLSDLTIGADAVIDRRCTDEELSVTGSLSIINYKLADINIYARGDRAYLELPDLADEVYVADLSDINGTIGRSQILSYAWDSAGLPRIQSVELFGEAPEDDVWSTFGTIRDEAEQSERIRDMWKHADVQRRDEDEVIGTADEREITCRIYDVTIPKADVQGIVDHMTGTSERWYLNADPEFTVYIDEYKDIRRIELSKPLPVNGKHYDVSVDLGGEELPVDAVDMTVNEVMAHISREGRDYEISITSGDARAAVKVTPKYDREARDLDMKYSDLSFIYAGEEILRSGGEVRICTNDTEVNVAPLPDRTSADDFDLWAYDVAGHVIGRYGSLIGLF